jgi:hypothetical protein
LLIYRADGHLIDVFLAAPGALSHASLPLQHPVTAVPSACNQASMRALGNEANLIYFRRLRRLHARNSLARNSLARNSLARNSLARNSLARNSLLAPRRENS